MIQKIADRFPVQFDGKIVTAFALRGEIIVVTEYGVYRMSEPFDFIQQIGKVEQP